MQLAKHQWDHIQLNIWFFNLLHDYLYWLKLLVLYTNNNLARLRVHRLAWRLHYMGKMLLIFQTWVSIIFIFWRFCSWSLVVYSFWRMQKLYLPENTKEVEFLRWNLHKVREAEKRDMWRLQAVTQRWWPMGLSLRPGPGAYSGHCCKQITYITSFFHLIWGGWYFIPIHFIKEEMKAI